MVSSSRKPSPLAILESRRGFIRVDFDAGAKIGVATASGETAYDALDLTVYGVSFLVPAGDAERFSEGMELRALAFVVDEVPVSAQGRVVYVRKGLVGGSAKVAVELRELTTESVWAVTRHIAEKAGLGVPMQVGQGAISMKGPKKPKTRAKAKTKARTKPAARKKARR